MIQKKKDFCLKINIGTQNKLLNFENWCSGELSKIGHRFSNKSYLKLLLSKNITNKKCVLNWYSLQKKIEKDSDDF